MYFRLEKRQVSKQISVVLEIGAFFYGILNVIMYF